MSSRKPIGGFFELERSGTDNNFHSGAYGFSNGRTCFRVVLKHISPIKVYVPYYCCDTLLSPLISENINFIFYSLDEKFEPVDVPNLKENELFVYINYFGLKTAFAKQLVEQYRGQVVIDNTQNYFERGYKYGWSFNSARKFFGVTDGGYLYAPEKVNTQYERNVNFIADHLVLRLDQRQVEGFEFFKKNEALQNSNLFLISHFSESLLIKLDYNWVAERRKNNFNFYKKHLNNLNKLRDIDLDDSAVPFCYPFLGNKMITHSIFYANQVYLPVLWPEVRDRIISDGFSFEKMISSNILPLPVDHRYEEEDLTSIINLIN